jgi:hypothetical protein
MEVEYLDSKAAARFLSTTIAALEMMRHEGKGPAYCRLNKRCIRYRRADLIAWAEGLKVTPAGSVE